MNWLPISLSGPTFGYGLLLHKLVLAKDVLKASGSFPRTPPYVEECQYPEALDPNVVQGSVVICTFSEGFYNGTSTITAIINTAKVLGFMGFVLVANPNYGDFVAEPIPFGVSGIMVPNVTNVQVSIINNIIIFPMNLSLIRTSRILQELIINYRLFYNTMSKKLARRRKDLLLGLQQKQLLEKEELLLSWAKHPL